jgi:CIC family chloride channel protein
VQHHALADRLPALTGREWSRDSTVPDDVSSEWFPGVVPDADVFDVVGMGALFAAVVRAPLTGIALAAGLTSNYQLIWPLLATSVAASIVSYQLGGQPLYSRLLERTLVREKNEIEMGGEGQTNQDSE